MTTVKGGDELSINSLEPMRTAIQTACIALLLAFTGSAAQTGLQVVTGPTSFTGASNLEDGIQIASTERIPLNSPCSRISCRIARPMLN